METIWKEIIRGAVIGFLVPAILVSVVVWVSGKSEASQPEDTQPTQPPDTSSSPTQPEEPYRIPVLSDGEVIQMELEQYLVGVLLGEMPASYELEALKAQAVAARTFALRSNADAYKHPQGAVCTTYSCCQAYISAEEYLAAGGSQADLEKIRRAVEATAGQVAVYQGELIEATYFACSGGSTEDARTVWGSDCPYLQAVESPGEESYAYFTDTKSFTPDEFQDQLGAVLSGEPESWFGRTVYTTGGGVDTLEIGGVVYRGTTLRRLLGLRSTAFQIRFSEGLIHFQTQGYGHRVGMSQYGAQVMALSGYDYRQILAYYYQGTKIVEYR